MEGQALPEIAGFEFRRLLGQGGSASVYEAFDEAAGRFVAVKVLDGLNFSSAEQLAFSQEVRTMGAMEHVPNVVPVYTSGITTAGQPFVVMKLMRDGSLAAWVQRHGALPANDVVAVGIGIGRALDAAHSNGIWHCDIKPANLLMDDGEPMLADFGVARFANLGFSITEQAGLTEMYAAPEVISQERPTWLSDIYSLGASLFALAAGVAPFTASSRRELIPKILQAEEPPALPARVPDVLRDLIAAMMDKNPALRPQTVAEVVARLEQMYDSPAMQTLDAETVIPEVTQQATEAAEAPGSPASLGSDAKPKNGAEAGGVETRLRPRPVLAAVLMVAALGSLVFWSLNRDTGSAAVAVGESASPSAVTDGTVLADGNQSEDETKADSAGDSETTATVPADGNQSEDETEADSAGESTDRDEASQPADRVLNQGVVRDDVSIDADEGEDASPPRIPTATTTAASTPSAASAAVDAAGPSSTPSPTPIPTTVPNPTSTPVPTATAVATLTPRPTSTPRPISTPAPISTPVPQAGPVVNPTSTPRPTVAPTPTRTPTPTPRPTNTPTPPTLTPTNTPTPPTLTPTNTPTPPTLTPTPSPTPTVTPTPTLTPTVTPTPTPAVRAEVGTYTCIGDHINSPVVGQVVGFQGNEEVLFSWDRGSASRRASNGVATFEWDCNPSDARVVPMTAVGQTSGRSVSFSLRTVRPQVTFNIENPFVCVGTAGVAPSMGSVSGFDSLERVTISWTGLDGTPRSGTQRAQNGVRDIRWECDDSDARTVVLVATGETSGQTGSVSFQMVP